MRDLLPGKLLPPYRPTHMISAGHCPQLVRGTQLGISRWDGWPRESLVLTWGEEVWGGFGEEGGAWLSRLIGRVPQVVRVMTECL